jgi:hypothetical protein
MQIGIIVLSLVLLLGVMVALQRVDPVQKMPAIKTYTFDDTLANRTYDLDSLKAIIGDKKGLPPEFEVAAGIAYSAYPELKDVRIDMILTKGGAPMESTVDIASLLGPAKNRRYRILLNDAKDSYFDPILLRSLPFDAQVGILAHELGHIVYYTDLSTFEFGKWGLEYLRDEEFRAAHERTTDLMAVYHGLGSQIYQYAWFIRYDSTCTALYAEEKDFLDKFYMTDRELKAAWKEHSVHGK